MESSGFRKARKHFAYHLVNYQIYQLFYKKKDKFTKPVETKKEILPRIKEKVVLRMAQEQNI